MFVRKSTMDAAIASERARYAKLAHETSGTLNRMSALQKQLSAWVLNEPRNITPRQMAQMFYAQDDEWQAAFFNCLQSEIRAYHDAKPPGEFSYAGSPAGEGQWYHMAKHLTDEGFETIEAMFDHAKYHREKKDAA